LLSWHTTPCPTGYGSSPPLDYRAIDLARLQGTDGPLAWPGSTTGGRVKRPPCCHSHSGRGSSPASFFPCAGTSDHQGGGFVSGGLGFRGRGDRETRRSELCILSGSAVSGRFPEPGAFNVLSRTKTRKDGSRRPKSKSPPRRRSWRAPLSVHPSISRRVFHTYSLMVYVELDKGADLGSVQALFKADPDSGLPGGGRGVPRRLNPLPQG